MLVTNCEDNISRLWCETVLPDDGLISLQQLDPQASQVRKISLVQMESNNSKFNKLNIISMNELISSFHIH